MTTNGKVEKVLGRLVEELGFELVEMRRRGHGRRPVMELRIDSLGDGRVTVGDCARVSRFLEQWLDSAPDFPERYVLEVSSPGVERRLVRPHDFARFRGSRVALKGVGELFGPASRIEGELLGMTEDGAGESSIRLRLPDGDEVGVPHGDVREARIVFTWEQEGTP